MFIRYSFFFFNDTATTEIYTVSDTLSLHDALPISATPSELRGWSCAGPRRSLAGSSRRSEEHTSELQSPDTNLVCRLLLEKKKKNKKLKKLFNKLIKKTTNTNTQEI